MTGPGFGTEYGSMKEAAGLIDESIGSMRGDGQSFTQSASLKEALDYLLQGDGAEGPINILPRQLHVFITGAYEPVVQGLDDFLARTTGQLDALSRNLRQAILEYERRDQFGSDEIGRIQPPR
jgi:hypothetical protein